jgi:hypothetical protein
VKFGFLLRFFFFFFYYCPKQRKRKTGRRKKEKEKETTTTTITTTIFVCARALSLCLLARTEILGAAGLLLALDRTTRPTVAPS